MARSTATIQAQILDNIAADTTLAPLLTSTSKRAIYRLLAYIMAVAINVLEQLIDVFTTNAEATAAAASPATAAWLQKQVLAFQYSDAVPQVIQFTPGQAPYYPTVDASLQIITRCSVKTTVANNVLIKVATGSTPTALTTAQLNALKSYIQPPFGIGMAGINYNVTSAGADRLYIQANIYYQGQYSGSIATNVSAAITTFLSAIPFNGQVKLSDLEITIRQVSGVSDVEFINVSARAATDDFATGSSALVLNQTALSRTWATLAGYIIPEDTTGNTLSDTLTFVAE